MSPGFICTELCDSVSLNALCWTSVHMTGIHKGTFMAQVGLKLWIIDIRCSFMISVYRLTEVKIRRLQNLAENINIFNSDCFLSIYATKQK